MDRMTVGIIAGITTAGIVSAICSSVAVHMHRQHS
jgi:hypothetical protein